MRCLSVAAVSALLMIVSGCEGLTSGNEAGQGGRAPVGVVAVTASANGGCAMTWNGKAVTADALREQSYAAMEQEIEEIGGVHLISEENVPFVRVEAASTTPFACAAPALDIIEDSAFGEVALRVTDAGASPDGTANLALPGTATNPAPAIVELGAGDSIRWDGQRVDPAGLRERLSADSYKLLMPDDIFVVAGPEASFGLVYRAVRMMGQMGKTMTLMNCRPLAAAEPGAKADTGKPDIPC